MSIAKTTRPHLLTREAAAARIEALEAALRTSEARIDFLERLARTSSTGVSIDWSDEGYRVMSRHNLGVFAHDVRSAIDARAALAPEQDK